MPIHRKEYSIEIGGRLLKLEVSELASRSNAAVLAQYGDTAVIVTAVMGSKDRDTDFFPLTVDYEEKFYAAGKIIGSRFVRREGKPSDEAILSGRLIDRAIRPLFDHRMRRDVQIVVTVLAYDEENDPDFAALIGTSTALSISDIPWNGPVAGLKVAKIGNNIVINPRINELKQPGAHLETFVSGLEDKINMIELAGNEANHNEIIDAFRAAQQEIKKLIDFQKKIVNEIGKTKADVYLIEPDSETKKLVKEFLADKLEGAVYAKIKQREQHSEINKIKADLITMLKGNNLSEKQLQAVDVLFEEEINDLIHRKILEEEARPDGRKLDEVRPLTAEVGLFKRTHGSALFIRGNTQALAVTTLGPPGAAQLVETMETTGSRRFMLHYNFPKYSVGETGSFRGPGRRDIGHGSLAEKALRPLLPDQESFPYTIRVVSEILSSNGSSSMATVCAGSLSLMDAGVPLKKQAAGIAMGLITAPDGRYKILTDIQGPEDHHGDMDLKIAGTADGVTAIQMDTKIDGLTLEMLTETLEQAKTARLHILQTLNAVLSAPRPDISPYAPKIITIKIDPKKIGEVIGPGGKTINGIIADTGVTSIDIEEDGTVFVSGIDKNACEKAIAAIQSIAKEYQIGDIVEGKVSRIMDFGAIVDIGPNRDGMVHVSELRNGFVKKVSDVLKIGQSVRAKIIKIEDGKIGLSVKALEKE